MAKKGCKACRISKVKCNLQDCPSGACTRCGRLGLACIPNPPSRQGRPKLHATTKRLSPAVKAFLIKPEEGDAAGQLVRRTPDGPSGPPHSHFGGGGGQLGGQLGELSHMLMTLPQQVGSAAPSGMCRTWELFCGQISDIAPKPLKLEIVRRAFAIARQTQNWDLTTEVMSVARALKLSIDDAALAMADASSAAAATPPGEPVLPEYIREWESHPGLPAVTTIQWYGQNAVLPNAAFSHFWAGAHAGDLSHIESISGFNPAGDPRLADMAWLQMIETAEMQAEMTSMYVRMWAQVRPDTVVAQHLETMLDVPLRMALARGLKSTYVRPRLRMYTSNNGLVAFHCCAWPGLALAAEREQLAPPGPPMLALSLDAPAGSQPADAAPRLGAQRADAALGVEAASQPLPQRPPWQHAPQPHAGAQLAPPAPQRPPLLRQGSAESAPSLLEPGLLELPDMPASHPHFAHAAYAAQQADEGMTNVMPIELQQFLELCAE